MELLSIVVFVLWICGYVLWVCRSSLWVCRSIDFVLQESKFSVWSLYFGRNQSRSPPTLAWSDSTSGFSRLAAGLELLHPFRSSWLLVGHKLDPWTALGSGIFQVGSENFDPYCHVYTPQELPPPKGSISNSTESVGGESTTLYIGGGRQHTGNDVVAGQHITSAVAAGWHT